ncbi:MAG TPA: penicillin-binding protein [Candidatus Faecousia intestinavium]|nr:penicillin-binding protein [Candidatus Faecousia intestinavium]
MNRVTKRTWLMSVFIGVLLLGMVFFLGEYATQAGTWIGTAGSLQSSGGGTVVDRSGEVLLTLDQGRTYSENATTRKSTLHWLGDRNGFISATAVNHYAGQMAGFDLFNGIYDASGEGGQEVLTISAKVQNAALEALGSRKGTIGVYNYKTGEILCAVTSPTYDPDNVPDIAGDTSGAYDGVYLNRFLQSAYVPGSIFKIVTVSTALETVPDILDQTFQCYGRLEYGTEAVTCEVAHGRQNLKQAFANSCNCAFAQIAELVGKQNMVKYVNQFQVVEPLHFDGITTAKGNYDISETAQVSFAWSCIGQHSDLINPARYMTFMGAIASGGSGAEPYIVSQVTNGGEITYQAKTTSTGRLMSEETAATVREYMRNNVQSVYGSGNFPGLSVCAKSGTSQLGGTEVSNAMFAGFVENEEYPLAFIVVVENGGYGSHTCVPILSKVLAACKEVLDAA